MLWLKDLPNLSAAARKLLEYRGVLPVDSAQRRVAVADMRSQLSRRRNGRNPDALLSSVTEIALALGVDPVDVLSYERTKKLDAVSDDARQAAKKKRGK